MLCEIIANEFKLGLQTLQPCVVYRPFSSSVNDFLVIFEKLVESLAGREVKLVGDFNIDLMEYENDTLTSNFLSPLFSRFLSPVCNIPSRVTAFSAKFIDRIFLTRSVTSSKVVLTDFSDHFLILDDVNYAVRSAKFFENTRRIVNKSNLDKLNAIPSPKD